MSRKKSDVSRCKIRMVWVAVIAVLASMLCLSGCGDMSTEVSADLDTCVVSTLRSVYHSDHTDSKYPAIAYTALGVEEKGDTVTVYGVAMYREYTCTTEGELRIWGAENQTFALTAKKTNTGYEATECWWPKNGKDYYDSIEEKFPKQIREQAMNPQQYFAVHDAACKAEAEKNIADADKYVSFESEKKNVRLAYCPNNDGAYVIFAAGYNTDGTYVTSGEDKMVFTFGERKVAFTIDGDVFVYSEKDSANLPNEWKGAGDVEYFVDGVRFAPDGSELPALKEETAPVGPTFTAASSNWMSEEELREMFGDYMVSNFPYDSADVHYLPVMTIKYRGDLDALLAAYKDDPQWPDLKAENFTQFDEAFFKDNYLMMTYYKDGYDACVPTVSSYVFAEDGAWLSVRLQVEKPAVADAVVGQWLLFSGIAKEDHKRFTNGIEAYVEKVVIKDDAPHTESTLSFTGKVKQVEGRSVLMECTDVPQFSSGVWVELGDAELDPMVGETYVVTYEDIVMPSLPPRITAVTITKP